MDEQLHLDRIDPQRNMQRFCAFSLPENLFGKITLRRHWGRVGAKGQMKQQIFDGPAAARSAFHRSQQQKLRRGYRQLPSGN